MLFSLLQMWLIFTELYLSSWSLHKKNTHNVYTDKLIKAAEFVMKNNYFQFLDKLHQQILRTAIYTKFIPPYAC